MSSVGSVRTDGAGRCGAAKKGHCLEATGHDEGVSLALRRERRVVRLGTRVADVAKAAVSFPRGQRSFPSGAVRARGQVASRCPVERSMLTLEVNP